MLYSVTFCCTTSWISYMYTHIPFLFSLPPTLPFCRSRSSQSRELSLDRRVTVSHVFLRHVSGSSIVSRLLQVGPGWRHGGKSGYWNNQARVDVVWTRVVAVIRGRGVHRRGKTPEYILRFSNELDVGWEKKREISGSPKAAVWGSRRTREKTVGKVC